MKKDKSKQPTLITAGGKIICRRCQAMSKRTGKQCGAAADRHSKASQCKWHGGRSTGPKTAEGRAKSAEVKLTHGNQTREKRKQNAATATRLLLLRDLGLRTGLFGPEPTGWAGRRPRYYPFTQTMSVEELIEQIDSFSGSKTNRDNVRRNSVNGIDDCLACIDYSRPCRIKSSNGGGTALKHRHS